MYADLSVALAPKLVTTLRSDAGTQGRTLGRQMCVGRRIALSATAALR